MIGAGALAIWFDELDPEGETDFNEWYVRQHLPERLSVPGFMRGRRYAAVDGGPPYFTFYETANAAVLGGPALLERLNDPTDWTRRVLPRVRAMTRSSYELIAGSTEDRVGQRMVTARIAADAARCSQVQAKLEKEGVGALTSLGGVTGCGLYGSYAAGTGLVTTERRLIPGAVVAAPPFLAVCEYSELETERALQEFWRRWSREMVVEVTTNTYRLLYGLAWLTS